jgi:hypothetical protein
VSVVISRRIGLASRRSIDPSAKTPWLTAAITERAPLPISCSAASTRVLALIVKSSTSTTLPPATSPITSMAAARSSWSDRTLSTMARGAPRRLAYIRAFLANPASGETTTTSVSPSARMASHRNGLAYRSSTGMRKNPWIWAACRSMVTTRSAPATSMASAHTRARIDTRGSSFLSPLP